MPRHAAPRPTSLAVSATPRGNNLSQASEHRLAQAVAEKRRHRWLEKSREAMDAWDGHVARHGLPLADHRQF